jgi:hypothetical protein
MLKLNMISMIAVLVVSMTALGAEKESKVASRSLSETANSSAEKTLSLQSYLHNAYDMSRLRVEKSVVADKKCGDAYFLSVIVPSFWNSVQAETEYYVQTMTKESQDRLYDAIKTNLAVRGLPACLLQDQFYAPNINFPISYIYHYNPDYTTVSISGKMQDIPSGQLCSGVGQRQYTSCLNVQDPYGN